MRRVPAAFAASLLTCALVAAPTIACGGLIGPNGAVNLLRTTTFVGYHEGIEHYVTAFAFAGGGGAFGSITPLPGVPTSVDKGGDWTLQRLIRETDPPAPSVLFEAEDLARPESGVQVLLQTSIDALDITVLKGGGDAVGAWATDHGFRLPPDAPEVLDFYAQRSPIFLAASFNADAAQARGQAIGDGTPVHITIPTSDPWVPLRILSLGKSADDRVDADVFLLTDRAPTLLPAATGDGLFLDHTAPASTALLDDLRSDRGMDWVPDSGWLMKVRVDSRAADLHYDLAVDATGRGLASRVAAGLDMPAAPDVPAPPAEGSLLMLGLGLVVAGGAGVGVLSRRGRITQPPDA